MRQGLEYVSRIYANKEVCCAEIGVARGENAAEFIPAFNIKQCFLVDHWKPSRWTNEYPDITQEIWDQWYQEVVDKFKDYPGCIDILRMDSGEAAQLIADGSLDFVYIDASHEYEDVIKDINLWHPKVKRGGWVLGDDFLCSGVIKAVNEIVSRLQTDLKVNADGGTQWWYRKLD